jgi:hypothetical protein
MNTRTLIAISTILGFLPIGLKSQLGQTVAMIGKSQVEVNSELSQFGDSSRTRQNILIYTTSFGNLGDVRTVPNYEKGVLRSISFRLGNGDQVFHQTRDSLIAVFGHSADSAKGWDRSLRIPAKLQHDLGWVDYRSYWLIPRSRDTVAVLLTMLDKRVHLAIGEMRWLFRDATEGFWQSRRDELIPPPPPGKTQFEFDTIWYMNK